MISSVLDALNKKQREACTAIDTHVRIIAGAGSGKTRVLMARIVYLVEAVGVYPSRIMAITFTNKATNEMKMRLSQLLGDDARNVRISTIHSLCVRILREDGQRLGYPRSFAIFDSDDQKQILRPYYKQLDIDQKAFPFGQVQGYISGNKMNGIGPNEAADYVTNEKQEIFVQLYDKYEKKRKEMKAMDFDDLLLEGHRLLNSEADVRQKWQDRLDYIHVDEFQDVDPIQYGIVRLLTGKDTKLCVVGDPDQTIYTWRGASVDIILRFDRDFPNSKTVVLEQNYRSTQPILDASNAVIQHNTSRIKKNLFTELPGTEKIELHCSGDDNEEPLYIARQIHELHRKGISYTDMAILYRSNYSSRAFERIFRKLSIPYVIYGGIRFYERQEIKDALCYLRLCSRTDEDDPLQLSLDLAVLRVLNLPRRGIGSVSIEKLRREADRRHVNILEVMREPQGLRGAFVKKCRDFVTLIDRLRSHRDNYALEEYLNYILEESGYMSMLKENHEEERLENLKELQADIVAGLKENPDMTLEDYLQDIALFTDRSDTEQREYVSLMTVHAAKGLEFDTVFLVNFNEGVFPSTRSIQEGGKSALEEERRLCYVAMTRAKNRLFISWNQGYSYMLETYKTPSRFLQEVPDAFTNKEIKAESSVFSKENVHKTNVRNIQYRKGDIVEHTVYGQGVVLDVKGIITTIAFGHKIGVKKMNAQHPSIKKIGGE